MRPLRPLLKLANDWKPRGTASVNKGFLVYNQEFLLITFQWRILTFKEFKCL